jgi:hypothetical protein
VPQGSPEALPGKSITTKTLRTPRVTKKIIFGGGLSPTLKILVSLGVLGSLVVILIF